MRSTVATRLGAIVVFVALAGAAVAACRPVYFGDAVTYPEGCGELERDAAQCAALVDAAQEHLRLSDEDIAEVHLLTEDRCEYDRSILCVRSGHLSLSVRFTLRNGSFQWIALYCGLSAPKQPFC